MIKFKLVNRSCSFLGEEFMEAGEVKKSRRKVVKKGFVFVCF
jgi:hypothetical protein